MTTGPELIKDEGYSVQDGSVKDGTSTHSEPAPGSEVAKEFTLQSTLAILGGFLAAFCTAGFTNSFGVFQEYYGKHELADNSPFQIVWIASFQSFILFAFAPLSGGMSDKIGPFVPLTIGAIITPFSVFMLSLCTEYYQFFLAQGLLMGIGMSFLVIPGVATVSKFFKKHAGLTMGIVISGSSVGGVIWPIEADQLLYTHGLSFGWTMRILGFTMLPLALAVPLLLRPKKEVHKASPADGAQIEEQPVVSTEVSEADKGKKKTDFSILKKPTFWMLCSGISVLFLGFFTPLFFITSYGVDKGMAPSFAFYLTSITLSASFFGRIAPGFYADKYGPFNILFLSAAVSAVIAFTWTTATSTAGIIVWALAYGFASGSFLSLQSTCAARISTPETRGMSIGLVMGGGAITGLVGPPISGALEPRGYLDLSMFVGAVLTAGSVLILGARLAQNRNLRAVV